ncbi:MAG: glutathione S-transferase C-terminal domain-containing protein [Pseudomonadota bacterium]
MKVLGSLTSPYVRKVRIVMAEKKLDFQLVLEDVWGANQVDVHNPLGKVPCLVMEGGETLFDSRVIVEYLDTLSPVGRLIPARGRDRAEVRTWEALADGLLDAGVAARLEQTWPGRPDAQRNAAWVDRQLNKVNAALARMSDGLAERPWFFGIHMTLADIAVGGALTWLDFRLPTLGWREAHPNLAKFADKMNSRPSFIDTAPPVAP